MNCSHWTLKDGSDITMPARKMDCPAILGAEVFLAVGTSEGLSFPLKTFREGALLPRRTTAPGFGRVSCRREGRNGMQVITNTGTRPEAMGDVPGICELP
ncbi:uncharacterized protein METZ01_LOCUS390841, partial [marine metagenome]